MKMNQTKDQRFYNKNVSRYLLRIKDNLLEEEYLVNQFKNNCVRGKSIGFILLIYQIVYMILYFQKDSAFIEGQFIVVNSLITLIYILILIINYLRYKNVKIIHPILLLSLSILQGFNDHYLQIYYEKYLSKQGNYSNDNVYEYFVDLTYYSQMKGVSLSMITLILVGCITSFRFRIFLCLLYIIGIKSWAFYHIEGIYEKTLTLISCVVTILIVMLYFYFQERSLRCAFLDQKKGTIYKDTIDRMVPTNIITAKFDNMMSRLNFISSNQEASKSLGVNNESSFQQFLESCQIEKIDASPIISISEFDNTFKRLSGVNGQLTLKQICKEILIRQNQSQNRFKPPRSYNQLQQNGESIYNNSQIGLNNNLYKQSATMLQIPSQCILPSPQISKKQKSKSCYMKNSMKIIDLKQQNKKPYSQQSNIGLASVNELRSTGFMLNNNMNNSFYQSDNLQNQTGTFNYLNSKAAIYSSFQGEIKQDDGVKKKVNIRIWSYRLIEDYVVVCIEDQSFKQQFISQKDKNIVMQFFLQYFISKQKDLTKRCLAEQKQAYSQLRYPLLNQRQKTITIDQIPCNSFTQQVKRAMLGQQPQFQDNLDSVSLIDSNFQNHQNNTNNLRISFVNSPQQNPHSNPFINTEMLGSQIEDINLELIGDDRKTIISQTKQYQQSKSNNKRIQSADTSLHNVDSYLNKASNYNEIDSKQTQQPNGIPLSNDNTYQFSLEQHPQVQQSQGDIISSSNYKISWDCKSQAQQQLDTPKIQEDRVIEDDTYNHYRKKNKLRESKSLSPKNQNIDLNNLQNYYQVKKELSKVTSPNSNKKNQRSLTYHQNSNPNQQSNILKIGQQQMRGRLNQQKLSLVKTLNSHQEKQLSDSEDESFMKLQKVNMVNPTYSNQSTTQAGQMFSIKYEQQSPTQILERGRKPSIFQTLARSPTNETDKTQNQYQQQYTQEQTNTMIRAMRNIKNSEFNLYQAKYLSQNYNILQGFLFQNRSFKYSLFNTQILDLVKSILHICSPLVEKKQLKVLISDKNLDDESSRNLYQDKERLTILLFNIILNSLFYCKVKSQISIYFQSIDELSREDDNIQNSILIQDQVSSLQDIQIANIVLNNNKEEDYFNNQQTNHILKNKSQGQILLSNLNKQPQNNVINSSYKEQQTQQKRVSLSIINNMRDNSPLDPNQLRLIIVNECEDQQSALYKIEESNKTNPEQLLQTAIQLIQTTTQQEAANQQQQQQQQQQQNPLQEPLKNTYQYILKKRISQQYIPEQKLFSLPSDENPRANISRKPTLANAFVTREPAQSVYFNQQQVSQNSLKIGIIVAKYILRKIGPYERISYSGLGNSQIKTELIIYKDLRLLEPEQPLRTRQTIYSQQFSQGSTQNISPERENKSKFYNSNNNTFIQNKSIQSKSQIPIFDQFNENPNDKNKEDESSVSKQMIGKKIKIKFGEQPVYFEDINERDKQNSSAISEDFSRASIPIERPHFTLTSPIHKTIDIKNNFSPL